MIHFAQIILVAIGTPEVMDFLPRMQVAYTQRPSWMSRVPRMGRSSSISVGLGPQTSTMGTPHK
jgi:hypothetical protein